MMEREYGHGGAYGGPRGEAAYGGLRGEAGYGGPRGEAGFGGPRGEAAFGGPRGEAAFGGPRGEAGFGGPRGEAGFGGPRGEAAFGGPRGEAAFGGPRGEAAFGGPSRGEAAFGGPSRGEAAFGGPPRGEAAFGGPSRGEAAFGGPPRGEAAFGGPARGEASFGGPRGEAAYMASSYGMEGGNNRFGPYESYDSRSSLGGGSDLYRSGHSFNEPEPSRFADSYDDRFEGSYRNSLDSFGGRNQGGASWEASMARAKMRTGFMDERGRESYSSYSGFASPPMKPAPAGSRGRGMPSFPEGALGSRSYEAFGGMPAGRGRGMGVGGMQRPGIVVDYQNKSGFGGPPGGSAGRGTKRKMMPPPNKPVAGPFVNKKPKLAQPAAKANKKSDAKNEEEEEKRRVEARREKQRRRREKNSEKYGDGYRIAFTCSFCKFRTFEEKDIEVHLASSSHRDTLNHIQKQTKFDKVIMEFLHECMVNKFKKTSLRKAQTNQAEAPKPPEKDLLEGVSSDDHMMKVETVHCSACSVYVPALHSSVQQHIKSSDHAKSKQAYKEQIKRESVLTATSILNNPIVKARYELFAKGENPFDIPDPSDVTAEDAAEATENEGNEQNENEENEQNEENDDNEENENDEEAAEEEENEGNENGTT